METLLTVLDRTAGVRGGRFDLETYAVTIFGWWERHRSRCALRDLDARLLRDIGLTVEQRDRECGRHFFE